MGYIHLQNLIFETLKEFIPGQSSFSFSMNQIESCSHGACTFSHLMMNNLLHIDPRLNENAIFFFQPRDVYTRLWETKDGEEEIEMGKEMSDDNDNENENENENKE